MSTRSLLAVAASIVLAVTCASCDRGAPQADSTPVSAPPQQAGPSFDFFANDQPIPPAEWTDMAIQPSGEASGDILARLELHTVARSPDDTSNPHDFAADLDLLSQLGNLERIADIDWPDRDNIVLDSGTRIRPLDIAGYFNDLRKSLEDGALKLPADSRLSDELLNIGMLFHESDEAPETAPSRASIWSCAWNTAFHIRKHRAELLQDEAQAARWNQRIQELETASRHLRRLILSKSLD